MEYDKEISFGAFDSELMYQEIFIPEGFTATIDGNKIILKKIESEDERIRKSLIILLQHFCKGYRVPGLEFPVSYKDMLAWLEKQGKEDSSIQQAYEWGYTEGKRIERKPWIEKQNFYEDYNSIDPQFGKPINKVEPKFKDGDWVVFYDKHESVYQIEKIENFQYTLRHILGGSMPLSFRGEDMIRPWAIQDARDGDVLACNEEILLFKSYSVQGRISLYCWYNGQTNNFHSKEVVDTLMTTRNKIYPATKEQRNLLFQKMKEAGYTFDFEKKELKKVEKKSQRMISAEAKEAMYDKPTDEDMKEALRTEYEKGRADAIAEMQKEWGEKEKQMCADIIEAIKRSGIFKEAYKRELVDWLKSIKNRVIPQSKQEWSEEDEKKQKKNY